MANIRVTCPACKTELEVGAEFDGQEVECGNCLEVFKAQAPRSGGSSGGPRIPGAGGRPAGGNSNDGGRAGSRPPTRRPAPRRPPRRRRDDDDDDYEYDRRRDEEFDDDYSQSYGREGDGAATASLILGIIAVVFFCCWPVSGSLGLAATICGVFGLKSRDNRGLAVAGLALGILGMALSVLFLFLSTQGRWN